ncbi:hypothetical protein C8R44DRAFT_886133 [Mycena epipterygia]|nr:hypothetical protein C8R44DRAFT_886133 [Mycena epipterygia]
MDNWQPITHFIRVFQLLSNLRDLSVSHVPPAMISTIQASFKGKVLPSVMALVFQVPDNLVPILHCFPYVQTLTYQHAGSNRLLDVYKGCTHIHTVNNITLSNDVAKRLHEAVPQLKRLSVWRDVHVVSSQQFNYLHLAYHPSIPLLEGLDNLSDLRVRCPSTYLPDALEEIIAAGKQVFRTSNAQGSKMLRIHMVKPQTMQRPKGRRGTDGIIEEETLFFIGGH